MNPSKPSLGVTILTICFTIFLIIFCEFLPKAFAKRFNYSLSLAFAYPVLFTKYLTIIFVWPIATLFKLFGKLFKKRSKEEDVIDEAVEDLVESNNLDRNSADTNKKQKLKKN